MLCGDFGWAQRRQASAGAYVMVDARTKKILHEEIITKQAQRKSRGVSRLIRAGNYIGTSKGMEGEAFRRVIKWLEIKGLLAYWKVIVCDQDSSVLSQLHHDPRLKHVKIQSMKAKEQARQQEFRRCMDHARSHYFSPACSANSDTNGNGDGDADGDSNTNSDIITDDGTDNANANNIAQCKRQQQLCECAP